jgi:transcription initiation factor TFIID subunit TAF12
MMNNLYAWKNTHFKSVPKEMQWRRDRLNELQQNSDLASLEEKQVLLREMDELLYREEILWMQRSRVAWLREGDRNTKYFHRKASWRHKKNKVRKLRRSDGTWTMDPGEMENMSRDFFEGCSQGMRM